MKKDTSYVLNRAERFHMVLIGEGLLVGAVAGGIVLLYRLVLAYAGANFYGNFLRFYNNGYCFVLNHLVKPCYYPDFYLFLTGQ